MTVRAPHALAAALCGGIAAANAVRLARPALAALAVGLVAAAAWVGGERRVVLAAAGLALAGWWWGSARLDALDESVLAQRIGTAGRTIVEVTAPPRQTRFRLRLAAEVVSFAEDDVRESVLLELPPGRAPPQGARLALVASVRAPKGPEDGFDERRWLRYRGVHVVLRADRWRQVGRRGGLGGVADRLHAFVRRPLARAVGGERGDVLAGVVLGEDQGLSEPLRDRFRASGLYHLLAVSGQNVALIAYGALFVAWLLGVGRAGGHVLALATIACYVLAVGPQPSVIRAGVVGGLASLAWLAARQRDRWHFLLLAALVLLAWNPYSLLDPGFQLSFAAVASIFVFVPPLLRRLEGYPLPRGVSEVVAISSACAVATAPIVWLHFHAIPILAVPANALAAPAVAPLLGLGLAAAVIDPVAPHVASLLASVAGLLAQYLILCAQAVAAVPFAQVESAPVVLIVTVAASAYAWCVWLRR
jgi:competence protein ComEC